MNAIGLENTAFEGHNNAYLLMGDVTTLIDTGVATPDTREQLRSGLASEGLSFADIDKILLTHWHSDHAGLAGEIQSASGAVVRAHRADVPLIEQDDAAQAALNDQQRNLFDAWGMPDEPQEKLLTFMEASADSKGTPPSIEPFVPGERIDAGDRTLTPVHLPGHTAGLCGFTFESDRGTELFSGDALLPYYTPNVGGADIRVASPLAAYLDTLAQIVEREPEFVRAWPGHRGPIIDPAGRAADIIVHHRERTNRVLSTLSAHATDPMDAWTVSAHLFGSLDSIHILHGPGECAAHLDHLASHGIVENTPDGYVIIDDDPDIDALFPDIERGRDPDSIGPAVDN
jgi:glyoxylase-like metal-dependent hydrolase (beta-lactamase superfamily II)